MWIVTVNGVEIECLEPPRVEFDYNPGPLDRITGFPVRSSITMQCDSINAVKVLRKIRDGEKQ
jgi:hypothetical protein